MPEEVLKLNDAEKEWLDLIARALGLKPEDAAATGIGAVLEEQRKPGEGGE